MTLNDVKSYYKTSYNFAQQTGMSHACWSHWDKKGFIPLRSQAKLQRLSGGKLIANFDHTLYED